MIFFIFCLKLPLVWESNPGIHELLDVIHATQLQSLMNYNVLLVYMLLWTSIWTNFDNFYTKNIVVNRNWTWDSSIERWQPFHYITISYNEMKFLCLYTDDTQYNSYWGLILSRRKPSGRTTSPSITFLQRSNADTGVTPILCLLADSLHITLLTLVLNLAPIHTTPLSPQ